MVWRKQSVCLVFYKMLGLVLGFGFFLLDKCSFIVVVSCGLFLLVFLVFYKRLCPVKQRIFLISWSNWINCAHSYAALCCVSSQTVSSQNGQIRSRWFTLLWFITSFILRISEKQDLHAALHTSVLHFLWLVTNHIRLEEVWPELSFGPELGSPDGAVPLHHSTAASS